MGSSSDLKRYRTNLQDEIDSAAIYRAMTAREEDADLAKVYARLASVEERHAATWEAQIAKAGGKVPARRPSFRSRVLVALSKVFGQRILLQVMADVEQTNRHVYDGQSEASKRMRGQERSHARLLRFIAGPGGMQGSTLARIEGGRHRGSSGNALRAAVLGANDGLVSNLSLVMGVAGASLSERTVFVTGVAGLLAGACSMAMGEWISVQSSRELYARQMAIEESEIATLPEEEEEELALIYMAKGLPEGEARQVAARMMTDEKTALDTMTREELGIDPSELGGSPWTAASSSFFLFATGAIIPVIPFVLVSSRMATLASLAASAIALFLIGFAITLFTGRGILYTGARQLLFGLGAAGLTFAIGHAIGVSLAL